MRVEQWLTQAVSRLDQNGINSSRLDALILLEDITKLTRAKLLAEPETELSADHVGKLSILLNQRATNMPLAYIRGWVEFYGRRFTVTADVLVPRPESEIMIEELLKLSDLPIRPAIADIGSGSGALGITAALELPQAQIDLIEIDSKAAEISQTNVDKFTLPVDVLVKDLLNDSTKPYDVLLCNLPYVPDDYTIDKSAGYEPKLALYGGTDGLDLYRRLFNQVDQLIKQPLYILTESLPMQYTKLVAIGSRHGYELVTENDFILVQRCTQ